MATQDSMATRGMKGEVWHICASFPGWDNRFAAKQRAIAVDKIGMRLLSYAAGGRSSFGALTPDGLGVVDLAARLRGVTDLSDLLAQERLSDAADVLSRMADTGGADHQLADVTFERLLPRPPKILCIGVNYGGRAAEYAERQTVRNRSYPSVFVRFPQTLVGHCQALVRPPESRRLDYEGEIVVVIGAGGRRIPVAAARRHIAGVTLGNDGTVRDWASHGKFNVTQGKNWASSGSIGPWLVTLDEIGGFESLRLTTRVNGELRQDDTPAAMRHPIEYLVHYLSTFVALKPGDAIFTGTPTGAGARLDPPRWLEPGDVVEVAVPEIGVLRNPVRDEPMPEPRPRPTER